MLLNSVALTRVCAANVLEPDSISMVDCAGALGGDELGGDLLSSTGLVTSSEEYYPTVAINALMRTLRDPAMSSHHPQVSKPFFISLCNFPDSENESSLSCCARRLSFSTLLVFRLHFKHASDKKLPPVFDLV